MPNGPLELERGNLEIISVYYGTSQPCESSAPIHLLTKFTASGQDVKKLNQSVIHSPMIKAASPVREWKVRVSKQSSAVVTVTEAAPMVAP